MLSHHYTGEQNRTFLSVAYILKTVPGWIEVTDFKYCIIFLATACFLFTTINYVKHYTGQQNQYIPLLQTLGISSQFSGAIGVIVE